MDLVILLLMIVPSLAPVIYAVIMERRLLSKRAEKLKREEEGIDDEDE